MQQDQDEHRRTPQHSNGPRCLSGGIAVAEDLAARCQRLAVVAQVAGEEDHQPDLAELGRLERDPGQVDRQVGAVDRLGQSRGTCGSASSTSEPIMIR